MRNGTIRSVFSPTSSQLHLCFLVIFILLFAAVAALQDSIGEFHDRLPQNRDEAPKSAMAQEKRAGRGSLFAFVILNKGPDRR